METSREETRGTKGRNKGNEGNKNGKAMERRREDVRKKGRWEEERKM